VRLRRTKPFREILVFDWETAGRGMPGSDLTASRVDASACCVRAYFSQARRTWPYLDFEDAVRMARVGRVFRMAATLDWYTRRYWPSNVEKVLCYLEVYLPRIEDEVRRPVWLA
jgi:hypothetical protein